MRTRYRTVLLVAGALIAAAGYFRASLAHEADWVRVARDANYDVAIDRARIQALQIPASGNWYRAFEVWYRTDHTAPRLHNGRTFDREVVRAVVWCDSLLFKVISVDMSKRDGRPMARQRTTDEELYAQPWRRVERGATEEIAAVAACHFGRTATSHIAEGRKQ